MAAAARVILDHTGEVGFVLARQGRIAWIGTVAPNPVASIATLDRGHRLIDGSVWAPEGAPYTLDWIWEE